MKVLSVDLPWGNDRIIGFAWTDAANPDEPIRVGHARCTSIPLDRADAWSELMRAVADEVQLVLVDQPIGMPVPGHDAVGARRQRPVEKAWGNRFFVDAQAGHRIQFPRFQPGNAHCENGRRRAQAILQAMGAPHSVAVESFPQLVVPVLIASAAPGAARDVTSLGAHKPSSARPRRIAAQNQLLALVEGFTERTIEWGDSTELGRREASDRVDAVLGLVTGLALACGLPERRPAAVRLCQPRSATITPDRDELLAESGSWWAGAATWAVAEDTQVVRDDGIAAIRWW